MRGRARLVLPSGARSDFWFDGGDHVSTQYGQTIVAGSFQGTSLSLTMSDAFGWRPTAAIPGGATFSYQEETPLNRLNIVWGPDSNSEGRDFIATAPEIRHPDQISPNAYPHDRNFTGPGGPGGPQTVGGGIIMADEVLDRGHYDRVCIQGWGTGNQTTLEYYGTNGTDGTYWTQMTHAEAGAGPQTPTPPPVTPYVSPIMIPSTDSILCWTGGTNDAADPPPDYAAATSTMISRIIETDWSGLNWKAVVQFLLPPSAPSGGHFAWPTIRAAQLNVVAPPGVPLVNVELFDSDRIDGDPAHWKWERAAIAAVAGCVSAGAIL